MSRVNLRVIAGGGGVNCTPEPSAQKKPFRPVIAGAMQSAGRHMWRLLKGGVRVLRYAVFYPLMWLRILVSAVCHIATVALLIGWLLGLLLIPDTSAHRMTALWAMGGGSFVAFLVSWLYDGLLLLLSPEPIFLDGRRSDYQ